MVKTNPGTVIAAYDRRNGSISDLPNNIDVLIRRSTDDGLTWGSQIVVAAATTLPTVAGRGDPCLLYNPATGRLFCFYAYGPTGVGWSNSNTDTAASSTGTLHLMYKTSDDDGLTWSAEVCLTPVLKTNQMRGVFWASGHGAVGADGTLYVPWVSMASADSTQTARVAYSTNGGTSWASVAVGTGLDEHHVVELSDLSLLVNARSAPGGAYNRNLWRAASIGAAWSGAADLELPDPVCNGDVIRVDPSNTSRCAQWLLASSPGSTGSRQNLTVWLSKDNGQTWPQSFRVFEKLGAYSSMVRLGMNKFGIFWEDNSSSRQAFTQFTLGDFR